MDNRTLHLHLESFPLWPFPIHRLEMEGTVLSPQFVNNMVRSLRGISDLRLPHQQVDSSHLDAASLQEVNDTILAMIPEFLAYAELSEASMARSSVSPPCMSCCTNNKG